MHSNRQTIRKANQLVREGRFIEAKELFLEFQKRHPSLAHIVTTNISICNKKIGDTERTVNNELSHANSPRSKNRRRKDSQMQHRIEPEPITQEDIKEIVTGLDLAYYCEANKDLGGYSIEKIHAIEGHFVEYGAKEAIGGERSIYPFYSYCLQPALANRLNDLSKDTKHYRSAQGLKDIISIYQEEMPSDNIVSGIFDLIDRRRYLEENTDLEVLLNSDELRRQFVEHAFREIYLGRRRLYPSCSYNSEMTYRSKNKNVLALIQSGFYSCGLEHYLRIGHIFTDLDTNSSACHLESGSIYLCTMQDHDCLLQPVHSIEQVLGRGKYAEASLSEYLAIAHTGFCIIKDTLIEMLRSTSGKKSPFGNLDIALFGGSSDSFGRQWYNLECNEVSGDNLLAVPALVLPLSLFARIYKESYNKTGKGHTKEHGNAQFIYDLLCKHGVIAKPFNTAPLCRIESYLNQDHAAKDFQAKRNARLQGHIKKLPTDNKITASIIIPFKDQPLLLENCINSINRSKTNIEYDILLINNNSALRETFDLLNRLDNDKRITILNYNYPFNYSRINNFAHAHSSADYFVFLNNDTEIGSDYWLDLMILYASRPEAGAIGCLLMYEPGFIQHYAIDIDGYGGIVNLYAGCTLEDLVLDWRLLGVHSVKAVTGACMAIHREKFKRVNGFDDQNFAVAFNDFDICSRLVGKGYVNYSIPFLDIYHYETATRGWDCYESNPTYASEVHNLLSRHSDVFAIRKPSSLYNDVGPSWRDIKGKKVLILCCRMQLGFGVDVVVDMQARGFLRLGLVPIVATLDFNAEYYGQTPYPIIHISDSLASEEQILTKLKEIVDNRNIDIVIAHTSPFFEILPSLKRLAPSLKYIAYEHGDPTPKLFAEDWKDRENIKNNKVANVYPRLDDVIAISNFIAKDIHWPSAFINYNGIDHLSSHEPRAENKSYPSDLTQESDPKRLKILTVCRLGRGESNYKGLESIVELRQELLESEVEITILGKGTLADAKALEDKGLKVIINASKEELRAAYKASDVYLSCSKWEGFNLPIGEARYFGKPTLALNTSCHNEVADYVFDSIQDIAIFIRHHLANLDCTPLAQRIKFIPSEHSWSISTRRLADRLSTILATSSRPELCVKRKKIFKSKLSICIVTKDKPEYIIPCVESLRKNLTGIKHEILIGDTGSTDCEVLRYYEKISGTICIMRYSFYNFSRINNYLAELATGEFLLFLNNDTSIVGEKVLSNLLSLLENLTVGIAGPMLLYKNGKIQHAGVEIFKNNPYRYIGWHSFAHTEPINGSLLHKTLEMPAVTGAFLMIKHQIFYQIDGFSCSYLEECQDVDLCLKARILGYKTVYSGNSFAYHFENGTRMIRESTNDRDVFKKHWAHYLDTHILNLPSQRIHYTPYLLIRIKSEDGINMLSYAISEHEYANIDVDFCEAGYSDCPAILLNLFKENRISIIPSSQNRLTAYDRIIDL